MLPIIPKAHAGVDIVLVHVPYPGKLMFDAHPTSLLSAIAPFAARANPPGTVGYMDPGIPSEEFYAELRAIAGSARALCFSTSTAAIEEAQRVVREARGAGGENLLIVGGGPHEDGCSEKTADRLEGVDLSIAGDAAFLLDAVLGEFLQRESTPRRLCVDRLPSVLTSVRGQGVATSPWWGAPKTRAYGRGRVPLAELPPRPLVEKVARFAVFSAEETIPVMVSRGCAYGRCTFCAEGGSGGQEVLRDFSWLTQAMEQRPGAAVYFQDSIFPMARAVQTDLLPLLRESGREWGCQVYLPALSRGSVAQLAAHGCRYVYTGLESAFSEILAAVGKPGLRRELVHERLSWIRDAGLSVGISLMFGALGPDGSVLETEESLKEAIDLVHEIRALGVPVAGIYPNVETVLPGTVLAHQLARAGIPVDFYRMPRFEAFDVLEDGIVGYNFATLGGGMARSTDALVERIIAASVAMRHESRGAGSVETSSRIDSAPTWRSQ